MTMERYVVDLHNLEQVNGFAATPALENLFEIDGASSLLSEDDKEHFHSVMEKLLFLAKRARPDLLTAVTFLTTRVSAATEEDDVIKLGRVLKYLNSTADLGMVLEGDGAMRVVAYVDASYAVHSDYKSHIGAVIKLGQGTVATKSSNLLQGRRLSQCRMLSHKSSG